MIACHKAATTNATKIQISVNMITFIAGLVCFYLERVSVWGSLLTFPCLSVRVTSIKSNAVCVYGLPR
jgi:hypothetical protein